MCQINKLNDLIKPQLKVVETAYSTFYLDVLHGKITSRSDTTCMAR